MNKKDALLYHAGKRPGKIEVVPTKPYSTQRDLALAYSPGVAEPCLEIEKDKNNAYKYTAKKNLVAVISNGTAVLGLGNIGALAGKPVMEGKGLLFKIFADIDVFDIEVETEDVDKFIETVKLIAPTFGGINLEDIKAPECFEIERRLKEELDIPVMHDDQHGTAIISGAGLINALEVIGKKIDEVKVVVNGAGASAQSCTKLYISLGVLKDNIVMCDSKGVIRSDRENLDEAKAKFATKRDINTLDDALVDADVFLGLSVANVLTEDMLMSMSKDPVVFALANPNPEIEYEKAMSTRDDIIFATGRSDHPNQVNNVLGFPFIFRGALDVGATAINEEMKLACVHAIANLAKEPVPETVNEAYNEKNLSFGRNYIIPKPLDPRLISTVSPAIAKAAIDSGVAREEISDWAAYTYELEKRLGQDNKLMRIMTSKAKAYPKRLVFAEGINIKVLMAAQIVATEGIAYPILIGDKAEIEELINDYHLEIPGVVIIDPNSSEEKERRKRYSELYYSKMQRRGITIEEAKEKLRKRNHFAMMMVEAGDADTFLSGVNSKYRDIINIAENIIGTRNCNHVMAGMHVAITKKGSYFLTDTIVNRNPNTETLVNTTVLAYEAIKRFNTEPVMAIPSYSNFGEVTDGNPAMIHEAVGILHEKFPEIMIDGEMQFSVALDKELRQAKFPFSKIADKDVNTIVFPSLSAGHISFNMLQQLGDAELIGPILLGTAKPIHIVQMGCSVRDIVNMATIAVTDANQEREVDMCRI